jgi:hypothetical protein
MADVTGTVRVTHDGAEYTLRLTMRGFAKLQAEFGRDLGGLLTKQQTETIPDYNTVLRIVEVALETGMPKLEPDRVVAIADELVTADQSLFGRVFEGAFPEAAAAASGNAKRPKAAA